jgi:hypothetical protein
LTYSDLIVWIEAQFPGADYNVSVSVERKGSIGMKRAIWTAFVWPPHRTIRVDGQNAEQVRYMLEAELPHDAVHLERIDPEKVSA